jgi:Hypothetical protein (DUF2513)
MLPAVPLIFRDGGWSAINAPSVWFSTRRWFGRRSYRLRLRAPPLSNRLKTLRRPHPINVGKRGHGEYAPIRLNITHEARGAPLMKRDMDLIRELLLKLDDEHLDGNVYSVKPDGLGIEGRSYDELSYHLILLIDAGLLDGERELSGQFTLRNITWKGHDFLDSVRDPKVWAKTKDGALAAGGFTVDLLVDLAKGLVKKQIEDRTGIKL